MGIHDRLNTSKSATVEDDRLHHTAYNVAGWATLLNSSCVASCVLRA